jgi:outer membrane protein assembly factor BamE (lipoprotein component of BamABCDE complex)
MKKLYLLISVLSLLGCTPIVATRGNLINETKFVKVEPNKSTRADVVQFWGPPTSVSSFDQNTWYYIGETTSQKGIFAAEVEKRRIIEVKFNPKNNDTVVTVADLDPRQAKDIQLVSRTTPTAGKEFTALQQFVGNIGKYNTDKKKP